MRVASGSAMKGGVGRSCRGVFATGIATLVVLLWAASGAHAQTETFEVNYNASDGQGASGVTAFYKCLPAHPGSSCPLSWALQLERAGQVLGAQSGGPSGGATVAIRPQAGDVVRIARAGINDVVLTYDGLPAFDDTSCAMIGQRTLSGSVSGWHTDSFNVSVQSPGTTTFSRAGDRFQATAPDPLLRGNWLWANSQGTRTLSSSQTLVERSTRYTQLCGSPDSAPLYELKVTGQRQKPRRVRVGKDRRFKLPRNRVDCPAGVPHCEVSVTAYRDTRQGRRKAGSLRYVVPGGSLQPVKARLSRRAMKRLRRHGRFGGLLAVGVRVPPGDYRVKPIAAHLPVTFLAP